MATEPVADKPVKVHGWFYWFLRNSRESLVRWYKRHWMGASIGMLVNLFVLFMLRGLTHHYIMMARQRSFLVALLVLLAAAWVWTRGRHWVVKTLASLVCLLLLVAMFVWGGVAHDYLALYIRYRTINIAELQKLPITGHERLQPLNSIYSLAYEQITATESPQRPDFVRVDGEYRWTMAIEPAYAIPRLSGRVERTVSIPGDDPAPNFSKRETVRFEVGEGMLLGKNSRTATIKTMNLLRYFNYEPSEVRYLKDDQGKWVQVVSLIRWSGIFFPRPEFGGVQVIRQEQLDFAGELNHMLWGAGEWIPPEQVGNHKFLVGQNILAYETSRYMAQAIRFQNGFLGPMPWRHEGDVRIPDMPADVNEQPFTTYFEEVAKRPGMLYHYFGLEPFDPEKQGLSVSVFIPADGSGPVYVYKHSEHEGILTGVSAIAAKVMDTQKSFDWTRHRPVEHRPFIRDLGGERRFFWLTTIVTYKDDVAKTKEAIAVEDQHKWFIAGTRPNIVITDARLNTPVWVSFDPSRWPDEIKEELVKAGLGKNFR